MERSARWIERGTEIILEGTRDRAPSRDAEWREYQLPCMPGDPRRSPCVVTPYQHRLDWQMWFVGNGAARGEPIEDEPWLVHLVWQLLSGSPTPKTLLDRDPFPVAPPKWIRADLWRYAFTDRGAPAGSWWKRERVGEYSGTHFARRHRASRLRAKLRLARRAPVTRGAGSTQRNRSLRASAHGSSAVASRALP